MIFAPNVYSSYARTIVKVKVSFAHKIAELCSKRFPASDFIFKFCRRHAIYNNKVKFIYNKEKRQLKMKLDDVISLNM